MSHKVLLSDLNPHIICTLCNGYFIDPITIAECLHSFCRSCIVKHVDVSKKCPTCDTFIHKSRPYLNMRSDQALQEIVYKLVPGLHKDEMRRRQHFFAKNPPSNDSLQSFKEEKDKIFFCEQDHISLSLQYFEPASVRASNKSKENKNLRYLKCPGMLKIKHLKKFVATKYGLNNQFVVDVIYKDELLPEDFTLIDVAYMYNWRMDKPMELYYRIFKMNNVILRRKKKMRENAKNEVGDDDQQEEVERKKPRMIDQGGNQVNGQDGVQEKFKEGQNNNNKQEQKKEEETKKKEQEMKREQEMQKEEEMKKKREQELLRKKHEQEVMKRKQEEELLKRKQMEQEKKKQEQLEQMRKQVFQQQFLVQQQMQQQQQFQQMQFHQQQQQLMKKQQEQLLEKQKQRHQQVQKQIIKPVLAPQPQQQQKQAPLNKPVTPSHTIQITSQSTKPASHENKKEDKKSDEIVKLSVDVTASDVRQVVSELNKSKQLTTTSSPATTSGSTSTLDKKPKPSVASANSENILSAIVRNLAAKKQMENEAKGKETTISSQLTKTIPSSTTVTIKTVEPNKTENGKDSAFTLTKSKSNEISRPKEVYVTKTSAPSTPSQSSTPSLSKPGSIFPTYKPISSFSQLQPKDGLTSSSQMPNNRLQLKVQQSSLPLIKMSQAGNNLMFKQPHVKDLLWGGGSSNGTSELLKSSSSGLGPFSKALNQAIRQIPNPSLLTKNQSSNVTTSLPK